MAQPTFYRTARIDKLNVFYREAGPRSAPTLLLLHGLPSSSRMFEPLFARLSDRLHLVAPDYPSFGHSDWPTPFAEKTIMTRIHQPGEARFRSILPEDIDWKPFPAFPPAARLAVLVGHPAEAGPYVTRVRVPAGVRLMPHRHPEDRIYTVMSGVFYIGLGDAFDGNAMTAHPPGSVIVLPGDTYHFHWAKSGEYITQITAIGPLGLEYLNPADDPRMSSHGDDSRRGNG